MRTELYYDFSPTAIALGFSVFSHKGFWTKLFSGSPGLGQIHPWLPRGSAKEGRTEESKQAINAKKHIHSVWGEVIKCQFLSSWSW